MKYLLDTHVWLWAANEPETLSARARSAIDGEPVVGLATISLWEVAKKAEKNKLPLPCPPLEWIRGALPETVELLPITPEIAVASTELKNFHGDPADQLIAATAKIHRLTLITRDRSIRQAKVVPTLW